MYNPFSLEGKTILITGASSGIGRATAIECSRMGATLVLTGRNVERLQETFEALEGEGHQQVIADLSDLSQIDELVSVLPLIDGCVNNAGYNILQLVSFIREIDVEALFRVNTQAPIVLVRSLVKRRKLNRNASIVFTASISGRSVVSLGNSLYSATKGALTAFMRNAALDLASKKIRCNAVLPGMIATPLKEGKSQITDEQWEANRKLYPLKRFGEPRDVALAIVYLLSDASNWMTGTELIIDGGRTLV